MEYKIITNLSPDRWAEHKALRLEAVRAVPQAFGASPHETQEKDEQFWRSRLERSLVNDRDYWVFAESGGRLVGLMGAQADKAEKLRHNASVTSVYVSESYRGKGIAHELMKALLAKIAEDARITRCDLMVVTTQAAAIALYEKNGFSTVGTSHNNMCVDGNYYDEYVMEKMLKPL